MIRGTAHFDKRSESLLTFDGVPIEELAMELEISPCVSCGSDQSSAQGGMMENIRVENGVLRADMTCADCIPGGADAFESFLDEIEPKW
jgi:hypothetical protein